jgi:hypothetical protein
MQRNTNNAQTPVKPSRKRTQRSPKKSPEKNSPDTSSPPTKESRYLSPIKPSPVKSQKCEEITLVENLLVCDYTCHSAVVLTVSIENQEEIYCEQVD